MHRKTRMKITEINPLLTCSLCKGYLVNATTLTECLHSYCRNCIVRYLQISKQCPKCDVLVHKTRPLLNARPDRELQNIVYKLIPGLFKDEMKRRREYYETHPKPSTTSMSPAMLEDRGEVSDESLVIYSDDESMYLSLEYYLPNRDKAVAGVKRKPDSIEMDENGNKMVDKRYLRCPAAVCIKHIKKFIKNKFDLKPDFQVEITYDDNDDDPLPEDYTLMDVAYIYTWRRSGPMPLVFRVFEPKAKKKVKLDQTTALTNGKETENIKKGAQTAVQHQNGKTKSESIADSGKKSKHKTNQLHQEKENETTELVTSANLNDSAKEKEVDSGVEEELSATDDARDHLNNCESSTRTLSPTKRRNLSTRTAENKSPHGMETRTALLTSGL